MKLEPIRKFLQVEETDTNSALTESLFQKAGSSINFLNSFQYDTKQFFINGIYNFAAGQTGIDGLIVFPFPVEVVGLYMFNNVAGSSGTTELDIHWLSASGVDEGSIFSTTPKIASSAGNNAYLSKVVAVDLEAEEGGTGLTLPVFNKVNFDQFDALRIDCVSAQVNAENCGLGIWLRPR